MPGWVPVLTSVFANRKVIVAANRLTNGDVEKLVGHLVHMWTWALDNAESGSLAHLSDRQIAAAANWPTRTAQRFVKVLTEVSLITSTRHIHDWDEYVGRLIDRRTKERNRKRQEREEARIRAGTEALSAGQSGGVSEGQWPNGPQDGPSDVRGHTTRHDSDTTRQVGTPFATRTSGKPDEALRRDQDGEGEPIIPDESVVAVGGAP